MQDIIISGLFTVSLLAGGAASAAYSSDNQDYYDDSEQRCENPVLTDVEDICDDIPRVRDSEAAAAVSSRVLLTQQKIASYIQ